MATELLEQETKSTKKVDNKDNIKMVKRYELAYQRVRNDLPVWKRIELDKSLTLKKEDRIVDEFAKQVIQLAESNEEIFLTC